MANDFAPKTLHRTIIELLWYGFRRNVQLAADYPSAAGYNSLCNNTCMLLQVLDDAFVFTRFHNISFSRISGIKRCVIK